ncbi:MAG: hypothetical protein E5V86_12460, partial [Mesorhizobium sp.]
MKLLDRFRRHFRRFDSLANRRGSRTPCAVRFSEGSNAMNLKSFAIVLGAISSVIGATQAWAADATRVRGTVVGVAGSTLTVKD